MDNKIIENINKLNVTLKLQNKSLIHVQYISPEKIRYFNQIVIDIKKIIYFFCVNNQYNIIYYKDNQNKYNSYIQLPCSNNFNESQKQFIKSFNEQLILKSKDAYIFNINYKNFIQIILNIYKNIK